jgi:hypothetical protein
VLIKLWRDSALIVSLLYLMEDGASAEIAIVGNEGVLGISLFMGGTIRSISNCAGGSC